MRGTFHFRNVSSNDQLQKVVALLKERPYSTMEGIQASGIAAFASCISEINHNDGYRIGRVMRTFGKQQVHTYVLLEAPGWQPKWDIVQNEIVAVTRPARNNDDDLPAQREKACVRCNEVLSNEHVGAPICAACRARI